MKLTSHNIRRYLYIGDEIKFLNSDKQYVKITLEDERLHMSLSNKPFEEGYTRAEFLKILNDRSWLDMRE